MKNIMWTLIMKIIVSWSPNSFRKVMSLIMLYAFLQSLAKIWKSLLWFFTIYEAITHQSEQQKQSDVTSVLQVRLTVPFKWLFTKPNTQELHLKPGGAEGAALFGVLIFCLLPLPIGPRSGLSTEISPVTSYNSPLPAAASNGAGCISITLKKRLRRSRAQLSTSTTPSGCCQDQQLTQLLHHLDLHFKETLVHLCCIVFLETDALGWWCCYWNILLCWIFTMRLEDYWWTFPSDSRWGCGGWSGKLSIDNWECICFLPAEGGVCFLSSAFINKCIGVISTGYV